MSEYSSSPAGSGAQAPEGEPAPPRPRQSGLPSWLPYFLLAVVPALIVGVIVFALAGRDGGNSNAAAIVDGLFRTGGGQIEAFEGELPPGLPEDLPAYSRADVVVSFLVRSTEGATYFVIYDTRDAPDKVLSFYQEELDSDPWQVQSAVSSQQLNGVSFSRPDDADVEGTVRVSRSDFGGTTTIYLSFEDVSPSSLGPQPDEEFVLPASRGLPPGFPSDVPIYDGKEKSTVTSTQFQKGSGSTLYLVTFLTKNSDVDVIDFYRKEFEKRGWQVTDGEPRSTRDFAISIDFKDSTRQDLTGTVRADAFEDDATYTRVDVQLEVSARRGRGN